MNKISKTVLPILAAACVACPFGTAAKRPDADKDYRNFANEAAKVERNRRDLTSETAKYDVNSSTWQTLPQSQRDALRGLFTQKATIDKSIISHYRSYGIISEEKAAKLTEKIDEMTSDTPRMPFIGRNHKGK